MLSTSLVALTAVSLLEGGAWAAAPATAVESETFRLPALDPGIQLQVRNKHPAGEKRFVPERIVLLVHGTTRRPCSVGASLRR